MRLELKIETQLITWNEVAGFCWSKDSNRYARTKKRQQAFIKHEITGQLPEIKNFFGHKPVRVIYEWHTSGAFDLGNLAAGEKFLADSFNELKLWDDDSTTKEIIHRYLQDECDFCAVTIQTMRPPKKEGK